LASGSFSGTVRLWEVATGRERRVFRGHQASVVVLRFSPDGRRLISGGADAVGMVWGVMGAPD
jgi:WD40 repeat protein